MTTQEGNKIIAEFMGADIDEGQWHPERVTIALSKEVKSSVSKEGAWGTFYLNDKVYSPYQLKYHTSWDWLMPCVEKMINICLEINTNDSHIHYRNIIGNLSTANIKMVYPTIILSIQWYNQTKTPTS